jgi:hypothetical protein
MLSESGLSFSAFSASSGISVYSPGELRHHTERSTIPARTTIFYRQGDSDHHNHLMSVVGFESHIIAKPSRG